MRYQLVVQTGEEILDLDAVQYIEDRLIGRLDGMAEVDGHDIGSGEINIFILTDHPRETFETVRSVFEQQIGPGKFSAGYRALTEDQYTPLWPEGLKTFEVK